MLRRITDLLKKEKTSLFVIPAKAGIHKFKAKPDTRFRDFAAITFSSLRAPEGGAAIPLFSVRHEIASVTSFLRNDVPTQSLCGNDGVGLSSLNGRYLRAFSLTIQGANRSGRMRITNGAVMALVLCLCFIFQPMTLLAAGNRIPGMSGGSIAAPPRVELPVLKNPTASIPGISGISKNATGDQLTVGQTASKVVIDWQSFNIGADASVNFDQQGNKDWVALNRIWDKNPSLIYGRLTADGKIYLINQNGILFGPGSQVNVHTLIATALNMQDSDFFDDTLKKNGLKVLRLRQEDYQGLGVQFNPLASVVNQGRMTAKSGGAVFLLAPYVANAGLISAPLGQIGLAAGTQIYLAKPASTETRTAQYVIIEDDFQNPTVADGSFGRAENLAAGELRADGGMAGMYGNNVDQWGMIRSVTAYQNQKGQVELRAANKITTGAKSAIILPVDASIDPGTGKIVTVDDSFDIQPVVNLKGLHVWVSGDNGATEGPDVKSIEHRGIIAAPTGIITLRAADRVYLDAGSLIDAGGVKYMATLSDGASVALNSYHPSTITEGSLKAAELAADYLSLSFKLNSIELRDAYGQKDGVLKGETVTTTLLAGSSIGDVSQAILGQPRTALERSIGGARKTTIATDSSGSNTVTYNNAQTGKIDIQSGGDIVMRPDAALDVSGGVIRYLNGFMKTTKIVSGGKVYDISNAPLNIKYDRILQDYVKVHERYGIVERYSSPLGKTYVTGHTRGGDAGEISLKAPVMALDGRFDGRAEAGLYQTTWTMKGSFSGSTAGDDYDKAMALSVRRGLEAPRAGTLTIDTTANTAADKTTASAIMVRADVAPLADVSFVTPLKTNTTILSAQTINDAGFLNLNLLANHTIKTESDTQIILQPGGLFSARARSINHQGQIRVSAGYIELVTLHNNTSALLPNGFSNDLKYVLDLPSTEREGITLGRLSLLDASGERIDNSLAGKSADVQIKYGQTAGGSIRLLDETDAGEGVNISRGAVVDVSGGYSIDTKGKITGNSAGLLDIQGANITLDGDLRGYALADTGGKILGGSVTLRAPDIRVAPAASATVESGKLVLADSRFANTGFSQITLASLQDVVFESDTMVETSLVRLKNPMPALKTADSSAPTQTGDAVDGRSDLIRLKADWAFMAGPSALTARAGAEFEGSGTIFTGNLKSADAQTPKVLVGQNAVIRTAPAVASVTRIADDVAMSPAAVKTGISLEGRNVDIRGTLESPGGAVKAKATIGDLTLASGAQILAQGYNRPDPSSTPKGYDFNRSPVAAGQVSLAAEGNLILADGALINIAGSDEVENRMLTSNGKTTAYREAGDPGSLSLSFGGNLDWMGTVRVKNDRVSLSGLKGATLTIDRTRSNLNVSAADFIRYQNIGFDDITLKAFNAIKFTDAIDAGIGRKLTLNAPQIIGSGQDVDVRLSVPWTVLTNSQAPGTLPAGLDIGNFSVSADWIDVIGAVNIGGFAAVNLTAAHDIKLSEAVTGVSGDYKKGGLLAATGDVTLDADRIYAGNFYDYSSGLSSVDFTGTYSDFRVSAGKKITVQNTGEYAEGIIYSAGGKLTLNGAEGIEVKKGGYLAAPLGQITLNAPGQRIYLAEGSTLTTAGSSSIAVKYGFVNDNNLWVTQNEKISTGSDAVTTVTADSLSKKVSLTADSVIVRDGAQINVEGGGSIYAAKFQAGVAGSYDPLTKSNRFLVFKNNTYSQPGDTIYLKGAAGLADGTYTIIPLNQQTAKYAFLPGAYILETQKGTAVPASGAKSWSKDGYPLTAGYAGVAGTAIQSTKPQVFSVRTAAEVIQTEGDYLKPSLIAGNAGDITVAGSTVILAGNLKANALDGYSSGKINLSATNITLKKTVQSLLSAEFNFDSTLDDSMRDQLILTYDSLSGKGFREIMLGNQGTQINTKNVTLEAAAADNPAELNASNLKLSATDKIDIQGYVRLAAHTDSGVDSGEGVVAIATAGTLFVADNAEASATHKISLDVNDVKNIKGKLNSPGLELKSTNIYFGETDQNRGTATGLHATADVLERFSGYENLTFTGKSDLQFLGDTTLAASGILTLDAHKLLDMKTNGGSIVTLAASEINIQNSQAGSSSTVLPSGRTVQGTFTATASDGINIGSGQGDMAFGGFAAINLSAANDLAFKGKSTLTTGNANVNISAARVITKAGSTNSKGYVAPYFNINAGTGNIAMNPSAAGKTASSDAVAGGLLEMTGKSISLSTILQSDAGTIKLAATGTENSDGIILNDGGKILARGTADAPGGKVTLSAVKGAFTLTEKSLIDVSAGAQGDAGSIALLASAGGVVLNGDIQGKANGGKGGSFTMNTSAITDFAALNSKLAAGGFNEVIQLRARTGNIDIPSNQILAARSITLTADDAGKDVNGNNLGNINVDGVIDASGASGGTVELYAQNDVNIKNSGKIHAKATGAGASGGDVLLSAANGFVNVESGSEINVSGGESGSGGTVYLRAKRSDKTGSDANMRIDGTLTGYSNLYAEAFWVYDNVSTINAALMNAWKTDTQNFMANASAIKNKIITNGSMLAGFHLLPGLEVRSTGDMNLTSAWDLTTWRNNGEPGVVTLRAGGNLNIKSNLVDHPTAAGKLTTETDRNSWGMNLVAGADTASADYMAFVQGTGDLNLLVNPASSSSAGTLVYTENAPIRFAAGNNVNIGPGVKAGYTTVIMAPYAGMAGVTDLNVAEDREISFTYGNVPYSVILKAGQYASGEELAAALKKALNGTLAGEIFDVDYGITVAGRLSLKNYSSVSTITIFSDESADYTAVKSQLGFLQNMKNVIDMPTSIMAYNLASYNGSIRGNVGQDLIIKGGAIQTATGNIDISTGRDIQLNKGSIGATSYTGAIRTTGQASGSLVVNLNDLEKTLPWNFTGGGSIALDAGGHIGTKSGTSWTAANDELAWDYFATVTVKPENTAYYYGMFSANYYNGKPTAGIVTMGGGNVWVRTGGDFLAQTGAFGTGGWNYFSSTNAANGFKGGNLSVYAGGDVLGRFLNMNGLGEIHALGNFGSASSRQQIELFNSKMDVTAAGEIQIAAVLNPSLASSKNPGLPKASFDGCTYTVDTAIDLKAGTDVTMAGAAVYNIFSDAANKERTTILPATVSIEAGRDIHLLNYFTLTSSPVGNLRLIAGGDIRGANKDGADTSHMLSISDRSPDSWYGRFSLYSNTGQNKTWFTNRRVNDDKIDYSHELYTDTSGRTSALHYNDSEPIEISAGGDIRKLRFYFPKKALVTAGRDIIDVTYEGQNLHTNDVSVIQAGRNLSLLNVKNVNDASNAMLGLIQGGPGVFFVSAGGSMELGVAKDGIQTVGNGRNPLLGTGESSLVMLSGYRFNLTETASAGADSTAEKTIGDIRSFFTALQEAGDVYAQLSAKGKLDEAEALLSKTRAETIAPFLGEPTGMGDISMTSSQIGTSIGKSDIFIISRGDLNLGKTAMPAGNKLSSKTGITTGGGGAINIFTSGEDIDLDTATRGSLNVNESRIMTFFSRSDAEKQLKGLGLGKEIDTVIDLILEIKKDPTKSDALDAYQAYLDRSALSAAQKNALAGVKDKILETGNITIWADRGNINAGRGSRTAVSASAPKISDDGKQEFSPPAVGSGIRAASYGLNSPPAGNVYLFAPEGVIDAGEAEISGGRIVLAAQQVLNVQNIVFSGTSVGVPKTADSAVGLGTLSGASMPAASDQLASQSSALGGAETKKASRMIDDVVTRWLDVKVIEFILDDEESK